MAVNGCSQCGAPNTHDSTVCAYCRCALSPNLTNQQPQQSIQQIQIFYQQLNQAPFADMESKKYCKHCGKIIDIDAIICVNCGKQVEVLTMINQPQQIMQTNSIASRQKEKNKWVSLLLCMLFGMFGIHRFYEGKIITGIIWFLTFGLFGIGWFIDLLIIVFKTNPYYV